MEELNNNHEYQQLLKKYHELKEEMEHLNEDRTLFEFEIILDSGSIIHPNFTSASFHLKNEIDKTYKQLLDSLVPLENIEIKSRTDIISKIYSFPSWGLYLFCIFPENNDFKELLMSKPLSFYQNIKEKCDFKPPITKEKESERNDFFIWLTSSCRYKYEDEFYKAVKLISYRFDTEIYKKNKEV